MIAKIAAFGILWAALALALAPLIGERLGRNTPMTDPRETEPPDHGNEADEQDDDWEALLEQAREDPDGL